MGGGLDAGVDGEVADAGAAPSDAGAEACGASGSGAISCWTDSSSGLVWAYQDLAPLCGLQAAVDYCEGLTACGASDFRLPNIDELRSVIRGCPGTVTGGACPVHDGSTSADYTADCYCDTFGGSGPGGCYWDATFGDRCGYGGWPYWSSSHSGPLTTWSVAFHTGNLINGFDAVDSYRVRCVRPM